MRFLAIGLAVLVFAAEAAAESRHVLKGRIIRALAIDPGNPDHILVGQKAGKPGSGLVFKSLDGGKSWRTQNGNAPMAPAAADVQAVAALSGTALLAGSWQDGLAFITKDGEVTNRILKGKAVIHLKIADQTLYAGTWGDGLHILPLAGILLKNP